MSQTETIHDILGGRPTVRSMNGMVAAAHPLAANAGAEILRKGGNAFDAVAATAAALNVVEPFMSGLAGAGGASFFLAEDSTVGTIDFIPPVPSRFDSAAVSKSDTVTGACASATPGNLAGWYALQNRHGRLEFADVLKPAIELAKDGFPVSGFFTTLTRASLGRIEDTEWRRVFRPDHDWQVGEVLQLHDLSETLSQIAADGIGCLYGGALGEKLVTRIQAGDGAISMGDLESVSPLWEAPISTSYRDLQVNVPPPPAESFQVLLSLRILESFDFAQREPLSSAHLDLVFRVIRIAAGIRIQNNHKDLSAINALLGDVDELVSRAGDGEPVVGPTENWSSGGPFDRSALKDHTTSMSVADADGNLVCLTQSLGSPYGSGVMIPGTGVIMNNFLNWGDLAADSPNAISPGERLAMCLAPSITTRNGHGVLALGTPGSYGILQTTVQAMVGYFDYGFELQDAINMPRARLLDGAVVNLENRVSVSTQDELRALGHALEMLPAYSWQTGGMQAVGRDSQSGALSGAADNRRDGAAIPA